MRFWVSRILSYYAAITFGFARIVTAPAKASQEATVWELPDRNGPMVNLSGSRGLSATKLTTIWAFPGRGFRSGLFLGSVSTPMGSLLAITPRGCRNWTGPIFQRTQRLNTTGFRRNHCQVTRSGSIGRESKQIESESKMSVEGSLIW
ncbi:MAG: hypothetical protein DWH73_04000 [Planctomycetota bacterium]|nr:MAG: hypothetical protein DWH73_04000 [Planctomycetota bacterium]